MSAKGFRRLAAALLLPALAVAGAACSKDKQGHYGFAGAITTGLGAGAGPDAVSGRGGPSVDTATLSPGPDVNDDFALTNGRLLVNIDAVGADPSFTLAGVFDDGPPLENTVAPSGGNLVDVGIVGRGDDQFMISGLAVLGKNASGDSNADEATSNLVFNFAVFPDTDSVYYPTFSGGLPVKGQRSDGTRRIVTVGVILNTSGKGRDPSTGQSTGEEPIAGTATYTRGEVTALGGGGVLPADFLVNIPAATRILVDDAILKATGVPEPILVVTIYSLAPHASELEITTTIQNVGPAPISITNLVQVVGTGAFNKNLDVLLGGVSFIPVPDGTGAEKFQPAVTIAPGGNFGVCGARYVSFIGRDEPGISYTFVDDLAGAMVAQREIPALTLLAQLRSDPDIPAESSLTWIRRLIVGERADSASSSDLAMRMLEKGPVRGVFGAGGTPNGITHVAHVSGTVRNAPEGTIVRISEHNPTFFAPLTPEQDADDPLIPGIFGPGLAPLNYEAGDIPVATARVDKHGRWRAVLPVGFHLEAAVGTATATIDVPYSEYRFDVFAPGAELPLAGATDVFASYTDPADGDAIFRLSRSDTTVHVGSVDIETELSLGTFHYEIRDANGEFMPGTLRILRSDANGIPLTGAGAVDIGIPTGLEESLERAAGAGGMVYSATGRGEVTLHEGTYLVLANRGIEYEVDNTVLTVSAGGEVSHTFTLAHVDGMGDGAVSGDFHVHAGGSSDSSVPATDRVISFIAQGIDVLTHTDHDNVMDFGPAVRKVRRVQPALDSMLHVIDGVETTTDLPWGAFQDGFGHWNAYPVPFQSGVRKGGAPEDELRPPSVFGLALRLVDGTLGNEILQINHPRAGDGAVPGVDGGDGLLTNLGKSGSVTEQTADGFGASFDPLDRGGVAILLSGEPLKSSNDATIQALGATLAGTLQCDSYELMIGAQSGYRYKENREDWFTMLNVGVARTAMGDSDMHRLDPRFGYPNQTVQSIGVPRNYLLIDKAVADLGDQDVVMALKPTLNDPTVTVIGGTDVEFSAVTPKDSDGMRSFFTTGPFVKLTLKRGADTVSADPIGRFLAPPAGTSGNWTVDVELIAPTWVMEHFVTLSGSTVTPTAEVRVYVNGTKVGTASDGNGLTLSGTSGTRATASFDLGDPPADFWIVVEAGQPDGDLMKWEKNATTGVLELNEGTPPGGAAGSAYQLVYPYRNLISVTNPIFIDADGSGDFTPPAATP